MTYIRLTWVWVIGEQQLSRLSISSNIVILFLGLVHVGDELKEVNGIAVLHKRPEEISQILVCSYFYFEICYYQVGLLKQ